MVMLILLSACIVLAASCHKLTAEETAEERAYYEEKYANEASPSAQVAEVLGYLDSCVGGQYVFSAQGDLITSTFLDKVYEIYPDYFSDGRWEYFSEIADSEAYFPESYAWDCSGLWWDCANALSLYDTYTDRTANDTYYDYCTPITKEQLRPGDIVFLEDDDGRIVHMGIVGQKGYIYEAASGFVGVVKKRTVDKRIYNNIVNDGILVYENWNVFGRPKIFE